MSKISTLCNPNASPEAKRLMEYICELSGKYVLLGQHTQTRKMEELRKIEKVTGKLPALLGFELLSYSGNINWDDADENCLIELYENMGTVENALEWGKRGGIVTFTWHWYSPVGGRDKSFYSRNTDFDARNALVEDSPENVALKRDLDLIAVQLKRFQRENIPILWRPFHEAEGGWFWWGHKGVKTASALFRYVYHYLTEEHKLNNLIWVWNSPNPDGYPGDDVVDIITRDVYPPAHIHTSLAKEYHELASIPPTEKLCALGEVGTIPDVDSIGEEGIEWCWYMTWSKVFILQEAFSSFEQLRKNYDSKYGITLDKLPWNK